jgi:cell division septum initiation protein DivIVA
MGENIYFKRRFVGGLDPDDVHEHIQEITRELEKSNERVTELEQDLSNSNIKIRGFEEKEKALKETMQMINNYSHKVDQEAQERKNQILEAAQHEASEIIKRAKEKRTILEQDILRLKKQKQVILADLKGICDRHLALLRAETVEQDTLSLIDDPEDAQAEISH